MHKVAIGCDSNTAGQKDSLIKYLSDRGFEMTDLGSDDPVYANIAVEVASAVARGEYDRGILICGTGIGVSIAANQVEGARAALLTDAHSAALARRRDDANVACFGAFTIGAQPMAELAERFLTAE